MITVKGHRICEGGNHIDVSVTDGDVSSIVSFTLDSASEPVTPDELDAYLRTSARLFYVGLEKPQIADVVKYDIAVKEDSA